MKKKLFVALGLAGIIASSVSIGAYGATNLQEIKVFLNKGLNVQLNGVKWQPKDSNGNAAFPLTYNGTTYLPVKSIGDALGVKVGFDGPSNSVLIGEAEVVQAIGSSRSKPAPLATTAAIKNPEYAKVFEGVASVDSVIRGEAAWELISKENQFNSPAGAGYEYILATITAKVSMIKETDAAINLSDYDFTLVSSDGKDYERASVVLPSPKFAATLYAGASTTGYVAFKVKIDDATPLITIGRNYDGTKGTWFKIN